MFSLCISLLLLLPILHLWQLHTAVCHLSLWLLPWPHLDGATSNIRSAWWSSATTTDAEGHKRCCWPHYCATAATSVSDCSLGISQLCHGSSTVSSFFRVELPTSLLVYVGVCSVVCFLAHVPCWIPYSSVGAQPFGFAVLWSIPLAGMSASWWWSSANARNVLSGCSIHCLK